MKVLQLEHPTGVLEGTITLDGSKSISNRVLMIKKLGGCHTLINGLSKSDDTEVLRTLLDSENTSTYDVHHAGTSFRFLTAYLALKEGTQILTGSERMQQRPIGPLVDALKQLGANIEYVSKSGFPPLRIHTPGKLGNRVSIKANISSQYLTALILMAPTLPKGLHIHLLGDMVSESYLNMTIATAGEFGIKIHQHGDVIFIPPQPYNCIDYRVEADWSAASYYFSLVSLARSANIKLKGLFEQSSQGDAQITSCASRIGVSCQFNDDQWLLNKGNSENYFDYDFINQPDIAQTMAVCCAAQGITIDFTGLQTLSIKETNRIAALNQELSKVNCGFREMPSKTGHYELTGSMKFDNIPQFATYKDHRMAMSFAPLALLHPIRIEEPDVVSKSYPAFWKDMASIGFRLTQV